MNNPDYGNYTVTELLEAQAGVHREKFPERAAEIDARVEARREEISVFFQEQANGRKYQTAGPRFLAALFDGIIFLPIHELWERLIYFGPTFLAGFLTFLASVDVIVYSVVLHALFGQTAGKWFFDVKVVRFDGESNIGWVEALKRDVVPIIAIALLAVIAAFAIEAEKAAMFIGVVIVLWYVLEVITMLLNEKSRAIHDFIAGTVVVRT